MSEWNECGCGRGSYNPDTYSSCYECFEDRRAAARHTRSLAWSDSWHF